MLTTCRIVFNCGFGAKTFLRGGGAKIKNKRFKLKIHILEKNRLNPIRKQQVTLQNYTLCDPLMILC